ncbi:nuclease-related domain-containing DEAD/DEAH box helicase [Knoellia koreensis]|uniref:AAA family ATPase n=1 Tax=Knoellia koreensis TaxID=2730921 RepID=A0A849H6G7_9MICO|nr:NERD domain-containing protein/DEAD/DEAH box helicase [Knoellia sp. DB2414S]NNM45376.1 AAA family ATPase [Knoellia sp. DB2414S]
MPARPVPADPQLATESEREVWQRLVRQLGADDVVLAGVRLTNRRKDFELDLVALMPGAGFVVLEVKGGSVWVQDGQWMQSRGSGTAVIDPVGQARDNLYALREYVEQDPRWKDSSRSRVRWGHCVVFPYSDVDADFALPETPRWAVHDRGDQESLGERVRDIPMQQESRNRTPDPDDVELVLEILRGRQLPVSSPSAVADDREGEADRLTLEQSTLLKVTRLLNRVEVRGGAGSGKTVLALTQAKEMTRGLLNRDGEDHSPKRVALVCYSIGLAEYFKRQVAAAPRKHRPAFVGTFHELGQHWGGPDGSRENAAFWEEDLPAQMAELASELDHGHKFDAIVVDEAQDFADAWWTPLMRALRDEETGGLYVYSDENQRIFSRFGQPPVPLVPLVLDHNLRNTKQIAAAFGPLAPMRMTPRGGDGVEVRFVAVATKGDAIDAADEQALELLEAGWRHRDIALITTGSRHPQQVKLAGDSDQREYWRTFWEGDDLFFGHVLGCKGLERRAVVLCVNQDEVSDRSRERLYVGMSRATDVLVVVGIPEVVREMGGDAVARQLGI